MKTKAIIVSVLLIGLTGIFSVARSQTLKNPKLVLDFDFTVSGGNFLIVDSYKDIKKSSITYDEIKKLEEKTNSLSLQLDNLLPRIATMAKSMDDMKRTIDNMNKKIDKLEKTIEQQNRKISDLERKIK
ncbi:MAG: hypothetical protein LBC49_02190 [Bacteroidales bacterium]|jgi:peptidoglycan hydrolase CwlO-like protein|nr:hypothetical protein [Bacteroidales bacterium]